MTDKRLRPRLKVSMPIQVIGRSIDGDKFREICQTHDASAFGLCFVLNSIVERSAILYISMRMPRRLRLFDLAKDIYQIYAQVQRVQLLAQGGCEVGISFIGKNPPPGYESYQTVEYSTTDISMSSDFKKTTGEFPTVQPQTSPPPSQARQVSQPSPAAATPYVPPMLPTATKKAPDRRDTRHQIPIDISIDFLDSSGSTIYQEPGLITNISKHGACIMSTHNASIGSRLKFTMMREDFSAQGTIKAITTGQGGVWNLHIEFLDKCWMGGS